MKNCKIFSEAQTMSRLKEIIQPPPIHPPSDKIVLRLLNYVSYVYEDIQKYTDICFQRASRMGFVGVNKWCSANVISETKEKHVC